MAFLVNSGFGAFARPQMNAPSLGPTLTKGPVSAPAAKPRSSTSFQSVLDEMQQGSAQLEQGWVHFGTGRGSALA